MVNSYYLSQSSFDSPKRILRNNSNNINLFFQTVKVVENLHRDAAEEDMSCDEF